MGNPSIDAPPGPCPGWSIQLPNLSGDPDTNPPMPGNYSIPRAGSNPFQPPGGQALKRRAWSTIDPLVPEDKRFLDDLKIAYCKLNALPPDDHRRLLEQAWTHNFYCATGSIHMSWAFLPFHRAYVYFHEQIVGLFMPNPAAFRLPYWDWEVKSIIPEFFLKLGLPTFLTGTAQRSATGTLDPWASEEILQKWLFSMTFDEFAGIRADPGRSAAGPHDCGHVKVGGAMRIPQTAAADPLFYAHHANIDRFWDYWQTHYPFATPPLWFNQGPFYFYDATGNVVSITPDQLTKPSLLAYCYDPPKTTIPKFHPIDFLLSSLGTTSPDAPLRAKGEWIPAQIRLAVPTENLTTGIQYEIRLGRETETSVRIGSFFCFHSADHLKMMSELPVASLGRINAEQYEILRIGKHSLDAYIGMLDSGKLAKLPAEGVAIRALFPPRG